jgi:hypothetical protein
MGMILIAVRRYGGRVLTSMGSRSRRESIRAAGSLDHAVADEAVERLRHPASVEPRRMHERRRGRRPTCTKDIDDPPTHLTHRPGEGPLSVPTALDRHRARARSAPSAGARERTAVTPRHCAAVLAPDVHQRLVPAGGIVAVDPPLCGGVDGRARGRSVAEADALHDPPDVHVDRRHRFAAGDRCHRRGCIWTDARQ